MFYQEGPPLLFLVQGDLKSISPELAKMNVRNKSWWRVFLYTLIRWVYFPKSLSRAAEKETYISEAAGPYYFRRSRNVLEFILKDLEFKNFLKNQSSLNYELRSRGTASGKPQENL